MTRFVADNWKSKGGKFYRSRGDITAIDKTGGSKKTGIAPGNGPDPASVKRIQES